MQEFDAKLEKSRKLNKINVCHVTEFFFIIKLICGSGSLATPAVVAPVALAWWQWRWWQLGGNTAADMAAR